MATIEPQSLHNYQLAGRCPKCVVILRPASAQYLERAAKAHFFCEAARSKKKGFFASTESKSHLNGDFF
ncbi:MAG: hypothetical protein QF515_09550 [Pseudomonadales bacterium]|jgi:uncharacterized C2H2 Zn-finger protein|nr:hypothetical protein [Pseudomonadales bacterium]MDP6469498.1 hypothetical protein [Pseudomonadales bacterium]MDP6827340.1 hypothetical protein [Pseudomonadales bacterium]|tara:strand:- start:409 stop:615 length:207 start_codon:yes stop_codon:yes gene_type:complete